MPAGITHLILSRESLDHMNSSRALEIKQLLGQEIGPFLVGSVSPDIGYMGLLSGVPTLGKQLADDVHYKKTNEIPLEGLALAKLEFLKGNTAFARSLFAFYIGYASHLIADGIFHPFVRDMVGDYAVASGPHRTLEMKLDVLMAIEFLGVEMNGVSLQEHLDWMQDCPYRLQIYESFAKLIKAVHGHDIDKDKIDSLVKGLGSVLSIAEGKVPKWYSAELGSKGFSYMDAQDVLKEKDALVNLYLPVDVKVKNLKTNFNGTVFVNIFEHVLPRYLEIFPLRIEAAYNYVFKDGSEIDSLIPLINLDTGRPVSVTDLNVKPSLWEIA